MSRYQRQINLPEIGIEGQKKLKNTSVLCVGAGGLGCPALLYLTAAGIGTIGIIDFDQVDESNLQRQILYTTTQVGTAKTTAAKDHLHALNPEVNIQCYQEPLGLNNVKELFERYDFVIDGSDNFATKFLINDAGVKFSTPVIYGAIQRFDGQVSVFDARHGPCYRCLFPEVPQSPIQNCEEAGVIGAIAGLIGTTQAMQVIMMTVGGDQLKPLIGTLWTIDMRTMQSQLLTLSKNPNCPVCSKKPCDIILDYKPAVCASTQAIPEITVEEFIALAPKNIIDVREQNEWDLGHIPNAVLHPLSKIIAGDYPNIRSNDDLILYCKKGGRSMKAALILKDHLRHKIINLQGGYDAYFSLKPNE